MISAAESWLMEGKKVGKKVGKMENQIEMIQNFLKAGADWKLIINATGIDQVGFQKLKKEWRRIEAAS